MASDIDIVDALVISGRAKILTLNVGEVLIGEGEQAHGLYIVKGGLLRIESGTVIYETVTTGGIVGEMAIINEGMPRSASVIARTQAEVVEIDRATFLSLVSDRPHFALTVMRVMSRRLRRMNRRYRLAD